MGSFLKSRGQDFEIFNDLCNTVNLRSSRISRNHAQSRNKKGPFTQSGKPIGGGEDPPLKVIFIVRALKSSVSSHNVPSVTGG